MGCAYNYGGEAGQATRTEILCILGNNLFNQKYFFVLWIWWMFLLVVSIFGLFFRLLRICFRAFSKSMLMRKSHGRYFSGLRISSSEAFVLELVLDNLGKTPTFASKVMRDVAARLKELNLKEDDGTLGCIQTPLMSSIDDKDTVKRAGVFQPHPSHEKKSFYSENLNQSGDANLISFRDEFQKESRIPKETKLESFDRDHMKSCTEESAKLSKKERKKLKNDARKLTLEPLPQVKEEIEDSGEEIEDSREEFVKTEEPLVAPFPNLPRPSDKSVASFPDNSNPKREWL